MQRRFQELLSERGIVCHEGTYLGQAARNASPVRLDMNEARKILEGHGCPRCAKNELAAGLLPMPTDWNVFMKVQIRKLLAISSCA